MENEIVEIEEAAPRFTSEVTHDLPTRKEVNRRYTLLHLGTAVREGFTLGILILLFGYLFLYSGNRDSYSRTVFVMAFIYWGGFFFKLFRNRKGGAGYRLMLQRNGGKPVHNRITFTEEGFQVENTYTQAVSEYTYDRLRFISQTENFYLLYREMNQCTVISRSTLTGGDEMEFLSFLWEKATQLRTYDLKEPTLGITIRYLHLAAWALSLGLAVCCLFFL